MATSEVSNHAEFGREETNSNNVKIASTVKISLWLIPPIGIILKIQVESERIAAVDQNPPISTHVALVGGVEVNQDQVQEIVTKLKKTFQGFGAY